MYCVGGFLPFFPEFFTLSHVIMQGNTHCIFKEEILDFLSWACAPPAPGTVAGGCHGPTVALCLICLCHLPLDSIVPEAGLGLITFVHLSASDPPRQGLPYKYAQCSPIRAEPKNSPGSRGPKNQCQGVWKHNYFRGSQSQTGVVHNPTCAQLCAGWREDGRHREEEPAETCLQGGLHGGHLGSAKG